MTDRLRTIQQVLGERYAIQSTLGSGGMAVVYLADDRKHHRRVAIKVLRPELALEVGPERFLREIEVTAQLSHPHILPLYDSGGAGSVLYYVMPYVEGESLRQRLAREGQLPVEDALAITRDVAAALSYAHGRGITHRDIKPENIMLSGSQAIVADFGIAGVVAGDAGLTRTGLVVGTPAYMSPEQAAGDRVVDGRSDLYALASVLYEMLGGEPPHTGPSPQAILARQLSGEVRPLRPLRHAVTPAMERVVHRALAPAAADRFPTVLAFSDALARAAGRRTSRASVEWVLKLRFRRRWLAPALAAVVVVAAGIGIVTLLRSGVATGSPEPGLAIFPFRATGADGEQWTEQLPDLLATILDGTPGLRVADPWSLWRPLRPTRDARALSPADPSEAERLARGAGVDRYVLGAVREAGLTLQLSVRLYRVGRDAPLESFTVDGSAAALDSLAQRLAVALIARVAGAEAAETPSFNPYGTVSADALKAFLGAREAARRGRIDSAEAAIDRVLTLDSTFALGIVEAIGIKSVAAQLRGDFFEFMDLAERAARHAAGLGARDRLRVEATLATVRTDGAAAAAAPPPPRRLIEMDSTDMRAWNRLGYVHLVYGWQYGRGPRDALAALDRAVALDPTYVPGLAAHAQVAVNLDGPGAAAAELAALRLADTASALSRGARLAMRAVTSADAGFEVFADSIAHLSSREWAPILRVLRAQRPERAEMVLARARATAAPGEQAYQVDGEWARLLAAEGRTRDLDSLVAGGAFRTFDQFRMVQRYLVAAALTGVGDTGVARRAANALAEYVRPESALADFDTKPVWWTGWLVAAFNATFGDTAVTARWRDALETLPRGGTPRDYIGALQADLDARRLARHGELDSALALSGLAHELWTIHTENDLEALPAPMIRFHSAMLLLATERPDSAAALLRSLVPPTTWMGFLTARASYELGRIEAQRGNRDEAARHYQMALRLWERGGPEVADWRGVARAGLADLVGEQGRRD
jgi:tetratricopeptide (TPR) repeat protein